MRLSDAHLDSFGQLMRRLARWPDHCVGGCALWPLVVVVAARSASLLPGGRQVSEGAARPVLAHLAQLTRALSAQGFRNMRSLG